MKKYLKIVAIILSVLTVCMLVTACDPVPDDGSFPSDDGFDTWQDDGEVSAAPPAEIPEVSYDKEAVAGENYDGAATIITLNGYSISVVGDGAVAEGSIVTISRKGTYLISGKLNDGQIIVNTADDETVKLILNGIDVYCSDNSPIYVISAPKKVTIRTQAGSVNVVHDNSTYDVDESDSDAPSAAIFSMDDLKFDGEGELYVTGNYNKGIMSKDDIEIEGGSIFVTAVDDAIRGKDSLTILGGYISVNAGADGLRASNDNDTEKGYVEISGGEIYIEAAQDGIQAETNLTVSDGQITISCGGGSVNSSSNSSPDNGSWGNWGGGRGPGEMPGGKPGGMPGGEGFGGDTVDTGSDTASAKAMKAGSLVTISGGSISIDSSDDSIHSNGDMVISGGSLYLSSGDDGIHADNELTVSGGRIEIVKSYEGVEALTLNFEGGEVLVTASDDGINAAGGNDGSSMGGRPGQNGFFGGGTTGSGYINFRGSDVTVNAQGDGVDSNGKITMSDGVVVVHGPTGGGNGIIDYDSSFTISGGTLIAIGGSDMLQKPTGSGQKVIALQMSASAGDVISVKNADGEALASVEAVKKVSAMIFSSPSMVSGTYSVYLGEDRLGEFVVN